MSLTEFQIYRFLLQIAKCLWQTILVCQIFVPSKESEPGKYMWNEKLNRSPRRHDWHKGSDNKAILNRCSLRRECPVIRAKKIPMLWIQILTSLDFTLYNLKASKADQLSEQIQTVLLANFWLIQNSDGYMTIVKEWEVQIHFFGVHARPRSCFEERPVCVKDKSIRR
jgi:hypothetical protein